MAPILSKAKTQASSALDSSALSYSRRVDAHFHVFAAGLSSPDARYTPAYEAPLEHWQSIAAPLGVTHGVIVQTSFMGVDNRLMLKQLARYPETLRGVAVVAPGAGLGLLASMHAQGVRGIRLNLAGKSHDMAEWQAASTLWDAILDLGWHVELHADEGCLPQMIEALPQALPLVLDHFAKPAGVSAQDDTVLSVLSRLKRGSNRVYVKLSAPYRLGLGINPTKLTQLWLGELGSESLLWGSDWPHTNHELGQDYSAICDQLAQWLEGDPDLAHAARWANPSTLYGFGAME